MNFFKDTKKLILAIIAVAIIVVIFFGILLVSDSYASKNTTKVEPVIELTTDKVIIPVGTKFNAKDYIKTATDSNGNDIKDKIESPELNTDNTGTYEITYAYKDGKETIKSKTLKVIVANSASSNSGKEK